jgi:hypothetical protein
MELGFKQYCKTEPIPSHQDSGYGGDIWVSTQYGILYDRHRVLIIESPFKQYTISPPTHSPTGRPVELCPSG